MKRKIFAAIVAAVFALQLLSAMTVSAAGSATLTGPSTVRAGDTITLTFNVNGGNTEGLSGTLSYDSGQLTLSGTKQSIASPWAVEFSGNNMVAYDNDLTKPIKSNTKVFTVTFKVKSGLAEGTSIKVSFNDVRLSDGTNETNAGTISYSASIAAPLSGNCDLKSLMVSNATISPSFSAGTTDYTADVPYEVSKLNVNAVASRAEEFIADNREKYDYVIARAVAPLNILLELAVPYLKVGGYFVALKGSNAEQELETAKNAIKKLDVEVKSVNFDVLPVSNEKRTIIIFSKKKITNKRYPRKYSEIKNNSL